jgi:hypothetical protein
MIGETVVIAGMTGEAVAATGEVVEETGEISKCANARR